MGEKIRGKEIMPQPIGKVRRGYYFIPDCPDYQPRIDIPIRVKIGEVLVGWHCRNCKKLRLLKGGHDVWKGG